MNISDRTVPLVGPQLYRPDSAANPQFLGKQAMTIEVFWQWNFSTLYYCFLHLTFSVSIIFQVPFIESMQGFSVAHVRLWRWEVGSWPERWWLQSAWYDAFPGLSCALHSACWLETQFSLRNHKTLLCMLSVAPPLQPADKEGFWKKSASAIPVEIKCLILPLAQSAESEGSASPVSLAGFQCSGPCSLLLILLSLRVFSTWRRIFLGSSNIYEKDKLYANAKLNCFENLRSFQT